MARDWWEGAEELVDNSSVPEAWQMVVRECLSSSSS